MKILPFPLLAAVALTAATAPARADYAADFKLMKQFDPVLARNDVEAARKLIAAPNFRPLLRYGPKDQTLFERALNDEHVAIARLMMKSPGSKRTRWNAKNSARPLVLAAYAPSLFPILKDLARQPGFDINTPGDAEGNFPFASACYKDNMIALRWLVKQPGINFNARDKDGANALRNAGAQSASYLIGLGKTNVNARDIYGYTALHDAVETENEDKVRVLLTAQKINPNLRDDNETPQTALDMALRNQDLAISALLIGSPKVRANPAQRAMVKRWQENKARRAG